MKKIIFVALMAISSSVFAWQPTKPVDVTIPFAPGSGNDVVARTLTEAVTKNTGVQFRINNRPGAGGTVGSTHFVNNSINDGHFINVISVGGIAGVDYSWPNFQTNPPYTINSFTWATALAQAPLVIITNKNDSVSTPEEFVRTLLSGNNVSLADNGGAGHLAVETILLHTNAHKINPNIIRPKHKGPQEAIIDVMGGHVRFSVTPLSVAWPLHSSGDLKIIGMIQQDTIRGLNLATFSGVNKKIDSNLVWGIALPKDTPPHILEWYARVFKEAQGDPKVKEIFAKNLYFPVDGLQTPQQFTQHVKSEYNRNKEVVQIIIKNTK
jgi:tripartite-type tricarboxylate transporter receptor subunit TctC